MWRTGGPAYDDAVKAALGLERKDAIVGFLYVGTDASEPAPLPRTSWHDLVQHWGD